MLDSSQQTAVEPTRQGMACIVCGGSEVEPFLDLGSTALANKFLSADELGAPEPHYPLEVGFCHDCGHVQLTRAVPPAARFEDYLYVSSASQTLKDHLYDLSDVVAERYRLGSDDLVIDIGCNDATLLQGFRRYGVRALGVDPAQNLADRGREDGIERWVGFFNLDSAQEIRARYGGASAITATNTFPHIPALADFVAGLDAALAPGGVFVLEAHYAVDILDQVAFDTIYHEHVSYWALGPMTRLFADAGFEVVNAERLPIHHGQLRVSVQRRGEGTVQPSVAEVLDAERERGLDGIGPYREFGERAQKIKRDLHATIARLKDEGSRVVGYGAPAKGNTLMSFLEIGPEMVDYIVDRSPLKQGGFTPGTHIPVVPAERLLEDQPDYALLLAWNFADEVMSQQSEYHERGGRFILPVPEVEIR